MHPDPAKPNDGFPPTALARRRRSGCLWRLLVSASLVLGLCASGLWIWSYWWFATVSFGSYQDAQHRHYVRWRLLSRNGGVALQREWTDHLPACKSPLNGWDPLGWRHELKPMYQVRYEASRTWANSRPLYLFLGKDLCGFGFGQADRLRGWGGNDDDCPSRIDQISFPHWAGLIPFVALTPFAIRRWCRIRMRRRRGLCLQCGYDLRASPQRCPECGSPVAMPRPTQGS